jgi:RNA recognition motif-containing protein
MRDPDTGNSRGFGFISYDSFEASDAAIEVIICFFHNSQFYELAYEKEPNIFHTFNFSDYLIQW